MKRILSDRPLHILFLIAICISSWLLVICAKGDAPANAPVASAANADAEKQSSNMWDEKGPVRESDSLCLRFSPDSKKLSVVTALQSERTSMPVSRVQARL